MLNNTHNNQAPLAESQRVEFKRQLSDGLEKEVVAFLNAHDGCLPQGFIQDEFFMGYSVPQNKELMRVFRDVDLVEQLGSGIPRILESYTKDAFYFTDNFTRLVLPFSQALEVTGQATGQVTGQAEKLLSYCVEPRTTKEMMAFLGVNHREHFRDNVLLPLLNNGQLKMTIPDKPKSPKQRYITS